MRTEQEIKEKYEELNVRMQELSGRDEDIQLLKTNLKDGKHMELLQTLMEKSTYTISTDAQRYILEWVLGNNE